MDEHKAKIIKGRVIIALHEVLGRRPTPKEVAVYYRAARVLYSIIVPAFFERQKLKRKHGQMPLV